MKSFSLVCALALGAALSAQAQQADHFPAKVGTTWNYELTITRGEKSHSIRYATRVVREETLDGVKCSVFETTSGTKVLRTTWYQREGSLVREWQTSAQGGAKVQKMRAPAADGESALGRVLLDDAKLEPGTKWSWSTEAGDASGTIEVVGSAELKNPVLGTLTCLQLKEQGTFRRGDKTAQQERTLWFAPKLGLVREESRITLPDGRETTTEATLLARPKADQ